ncbi:hypothetical protein [Photobacterium nomapromontoriensis]|uniref:hypothetical protein n=1 Tax=Photobacterium nomapromontoriensis TaxID=2910237 RepID=UPI003D09A042
MLCNNETPREKAWKVMRDLNVFTVRDVAVKAEVPKQNISNFVQQLIKNNFVINISKGRPYQFQVINSQGVLFGSGSAKTTKTRLPANRPRQKMWLTLRVLRKFRLSDLMMATEVGRSTASKFVNRLIQAGYVRKISPSKPRLGDGAVFLLVRDTGPLAPIERSKKGMWDPNEDKLFKNKEAS